MRVKPPVEGVARSLLSRAGMRLGAPEMLIILVLALVVFGPSKLPQLGDALGKGIRNFKRATDGHDDDAPAAAPVERAALSAHAPPAEVEAQATVVQRVA